MGKVVVIEVPSEIKYIREVSLKILDELKPYKVAEDKLFEIRLCTEEALRNAMLHGNAANKELTVGISYLIDGDKISIEVEDRGKGFDPSRIPDPTENGNLTKSGGRGLYLIKSLMDSVEYSGSGNKVTMVKRLK